MGEINKKNKEVFKEEPRTQKLKIQQSSLEVTMRGTRKKKEKKEKENENLVGITWLSDINYGLNSSFFPS